MKWFKQFNIDAKGNRNNYEDSVNPFDFTEHALINGDRSFQTNRSAEKLCFVAPMGSTTGYVNRYAPLEKRFFVTVDFKPKTYADLILSCDMRPERKFADSLGVACKPNTRELLFDQEVHAGRIVHIGKEGNSLEDSRADLRTEPERQLEYGDSEYQDFLARLRMIPTNELADATGYNPRTIRRIKSGKTISIPETLKSLLQQPID